MAQHTDEAQPQPQNSSAQPPYVLAIDVGTSSTRTILFDGAGMPVSNVVSQHKYELTTSNQGEVSVDADKLLGVVAQTIDETLKAAGPLASQIKAVAIDTFWHSLLGVDEAGRPLMPVMTWEDTRPYNAALELRKQMDERQVHQRTGARFHASYWPAKLRWLAGQQPDIFQKAAQWISFGEYLHRKFLGKSVCSFSMASGTGMLTTHARQWDGELMKALGVRAEQLPQLGDMRDSLQGLTQEYAERWPSLRDVPWFPALGDGAAACVGSGCANINIWSLTMGTSSAIRVVVPTDYQVVPPPGLWLYLIDAKRAVLGGALSEGGNLLSWLVNTLQVPVLKDAEPEVAKLEPDSHGLTILPFISGERSLGWHADARMTVAGLSIHTQPINILHAGLESLAYQLNAVYEQLCTTLKMGNNDLKLYASGGALFASPFLRGVISDTLSVPIYPSHDQEASARGAALLALEALGAIEDVVRVAPHLGEPSVPNADRTAVYKKAAARQRDLYALLLKDGA